MILLRRRRIRVIKIGKISDKQKEKFITEWRRIHYAIMQ